MSYLGHPPQAAGQSQTLAGTGRRTASRSPAALVWAIAAAAGLAGLLLGLAGAAPSMDTDLVPLLRFMAVIKAAMALGAAALAHWRLHTDASPSLKAALLASVALMMSAPGLIWGLGHLVTGAVLFHTGLIVFLVAAARDGFGIRTRKLGQG